MDIAPSAFCEQRCLHRDGHSAPASHQSHKPVRLFAPLKLSRVRRASQSLSIPYCGRDPKCIGRRSAQAALSPPRAKGSVPARMARRHPMRAGATRAFAEVHARGSQLEQSMVQRPGRTAAPRPPCPPAAPLHLYPAYTYVSIPSTTALHATTPAPSARRPRAPSSVALSLVGADGLPAASFTCAPLCMDVRGPQITQLPEKKALHWTHTSADTPIPMPTWPGVTSSPVPCEISPPRSTLRIPEAL
ncbi:hypothetical protein DENSPDRAFT_841790 [Dentipellis sp. KUC8613]|nr:hypothetical protein DENSPDRAFT_841790 [Dentipellis sp. KUC8613]